MILKQALEEKREQTAEAIRAFNSSAETSKKT